MKSPALSENLKSKVTKASAQSFQQNSNELSGLRPEELYKTAFLHGYNCAYNIYDVAEEKINGLIKTGENPIKDVPVMSHDVMDFADQLLSQEQNNICSMNPQDIYTSAYLSGFGLSWNENVDIRMNSQLDELVDYYLFGKNNS